MFDILDKYQQNLNRCYIVIEEKGINVNMNRLNILFRDLGLMNYLLIMNEYE